MALPNDYNDAFNSIVEGLQDVQATSQKTAQNYTFKRVFLFTILLLAGIAVIIAAVSTKIIALGAVGFVLMLTGVMIGLRKVSIKGKPRNGKQSLKERYQAYMEDLERKDKERFGSSYED